MAGCVGYVWFVGMGTGVSGVGRWRGGGLGRLVAVGELTMYNARYFTAFLWIRFCRLKCHLEGAGPGWEAGISGGLVCCFEGHGMVGRVRSV